MGCCSSQIQRQKTTIYDNKDIRKYYTFGDIIGSGAFGTVRKAFRKGNDQNCSFALKTINKAVVADKIHLLKQEFESLSKLDHPNIIRFTEMFEDQMYIYFVMEQCTGGDLLEKIINTGPLPEERVKKIMFKLFSACAYMHRQRVMHRDLKPDNILFLNTNENSDVRIIDFGLSKKLRCQQLKRIQSQVGSPMYVAPEVLDGIYDCRCDDWSLGCIMYVMLCADPPFYNENMDRLLEKIVSEEVKFEQPEWKLISLEAKSLILQLLQKDPTQRITSENAVKHHWFMKRSFNVYKSNDTPLNVQNMKALSSYGNSKLLKRETLRIFVNQLSQKQLARLTQKFKQCDENNDGYISYEDFQKTMTRLGIPQTKQEMEDVFEKINKHQNKNSNSPLKIKYTEFLAATMDRQLYLNKERLWNLFKYFDVENKEFITVEDLRSVLKREGRENVDCDKIFQEIQIPNGMVTFEQFQQIMNNGIDDNSIEQQKDYILSDN